MNQSSHLTQELARKQELQAQQGIVSIVVSAPWNGVHGRIIALVPCQNYGDALALADALAEHIDDELRHMEESRDGLNDGGAV